MVVEPEGRACACGGRGCLEAEASGLSIAATTGRAAAEAPLEVRRRTGTLVGRAVASVANLLDLQLAVVAGSVALGFGTAFFEAAQQEIELRSGLEFTRPTRIIPAGLGASGRWSVPRRSAGGWQRHRRRGRPVRTASALEGRHLRWTAQASLARRQRWARLWSGPSSPDPICGGRPSVPSAASPLPGGGAGRRACPLPTAELWRFRMVTAYGNAEAEPEPADVIDYLEWCRETASNRRARPQ